MNKIAKKDLQHAIELYEKARMFQQQGKLSEAEKAYRKALKINRNFVEAHNNLGNILLEKGKLKEATGSYRKALKLLPEHPMLLNNVGNVLQLRGENEEAIKYLRQAIQHNPDYTDAHTNLGNALSAQNKFNDAIKAYKNAIKSDPGNPDTHYNLATTLHIQKNLKEAADSYQKAIDINPQHANAFNGLGNLLTDMHNIGDAITFFQHAIKINPSYTDALLGLANAFNLIGETDQALNMFKQAINVEPNNKYTYKEMGSFYKNQGELNKAIEYYQKAIAIDLTYTEAHRLKANSKKHTEYDEDIHTMESLYNKKNLSNEQRVHICFGLRKAFEDIGEFEKSLDYTIEGNQLFRNSYEYSFKDDKMFFNNIKKVFSADFFDHYKNNGKDIGNPDKTPIFVLGMPRSGTSLVEHILASHPQVFGAGELYELADLSKSNPDGPSKKSFPENILEFNIENFNDTGTQYIKQIRRYASNSTYIVDKMPHNFLRIGLIKAILPNTKIIHCVRNPMDNCLSIFKNYFSGTHKYAYDMTELGQYYNLYKELMEYWETTLPGFIYNINYEQLVSDQETQTINLIEFCGLPWDDSCLQFHKNKRKVGTASDAQVRRPMYKDSVQLWKKYGARLEPLEKALNNKSGF